MMPALALAFFQLVAGAADSALLARVPKTCDVLVEASLKSIATAAVAREVAATLGRAKVEWREVGRTLGLGVGLDDIPVVATFGNRKGKGARGFTTLMRTTRRPAPKTKLAVAARAGPFFAVGPSDGVRAVRSATARRGSWKSEGWDERVRLVLRELGETPVVALYYVPKPADQARDFPESNLRAAAIALFMNAGHLSLRFVAHAPGGAATLLDQVQTVVRLGKIAIWIVRLTSSGEKKELLNVARGVLDAFRFEVRGDFLHGSVGASDLPSVGRAGGLVLRAFERLAGK